MDNNEIWKPIDGFEGKYEVSNMGNVRRAEWCYTDKDRLSKDLQLTNCKLSAVLQ